MTTALHRYWVRFDQAAKPMPPGGYWGCGVTAESPKDALILIRMRLCNGGKLPQIVEIIPDIDVSTLDAGHVLPNMGPPNWRGIWYPLGFAEPSE